MTLQRFRQLVVVADEGSIVAAARRLRIAQPALSRQMRRLEAEVGATLFVRDHGGIRLTEAGAEVVRGTTEMLARLELLVRRTQDAHAGVTGVVRLGVARVAMDSERVMRGIARVRERLPGVQLDIIEVASPHQARALRTRDVDLAVGLSDFEGDATVRRETLFELRVDGALVAPSLALRLPARLTIAALREHPFLMLRTPVFGGYPELSAALADAGITRVEEYESVEGIYTLVAAGHGWTVGSAQVHRTPPPGIVLAPITGWSYLQPVSLRVRSSDKSRVIGNVARLLRDGIAEVERTNADVPGVPLFPAPRRAAARLELSQLEAVVAAVEEGSLSAAASRLHLTQSGVSRRVSAVEDAVGCRLLDRATHGVIPTNAGETLREEARHVLRLTENMLARARQVALSVAGQCRIGTLPPELTGGFQVAAVRRALRENPQLRIELREMLPDEVALGLIEHTIDIGITSTFSGMEQHPSLSTVVIMDDVIDSALVATGHPLADRTWITPDDLAGEPFMFIERRRAPRVYDAFITALRTARIPIREGAMHSGFRAIWRALTAGVGWTMASRSQRARPPAGLVAVPIEGLALGWGIALAWRRDETDDTVRRVLEGFRTTPGTEMAVVVATMRSDRRPD